MFGGIYKLFLFILIVFFCITGSTALTCYNCLGIRHPLFCEHVHECNGDQICGVERVEQTTGEITYNSGCMAKRTCTTTTGDRSRQCFECCSSDLCNTYGCGGKASAATDGMICYKCTGAFKPDECHTVSFCNQYEYCYIEEKYHFGQVYYESGCKEKVVCEANRFFNPIIGRDIHDIGHKRSSNRLVCCDTTVCNNNMNVSANPTSPATSTASIKDFLKQSGRDLVIIIDGSGSISGNDFQQSLKDVATLVGLLCPAPDPFDTSNPNYNQLAVISFSSFAYEIFDFKRYHRLLDIQRAIRSIVQEDGGTCTEKALEMAKQMFTIEKGMRPGNNTKKEVVLLTDGEYTCTETAAVISKANELKSVADVYGLLIGVGSDGEKKLLPLLSGSDKSSLFTVGNFTRFSQLVSKLKQDVGNGFLQCAQ